jgi:acyl carrier protein
VPRNAYVRTPTFAERTVAHAWREVLGVEQVGADEFLLVGGDSLKAHRILVRLQKQFGVELPISRFFDASTVAAQARLVEELRAREAQKPLAGSPDPAAGRKERHP